MLLSDICTIQTGYTARNRLEPVPQGGVLAIQLRDISPVGTIVPGALTRVALDGLPERFFVGAGDIIFRSRGENNTATALGNRFGEPAVAILPLIVLRPKRGLALAEYVAWALNQPKAQRHFDETARGTSVRMVPKSSLDELELDVPDLEMQRRIVQIDSLAGREQTLTLLLAEKRRTLINRALAERAAPSCSAEQMTRRTQ